MPHTGHVYVAVSGYGKRVVPAAMPFEFARADDEALVATATSGDSPHTRRIATDAPSDRDMANPVATVIQGPERREWWIDTGGVYSVPLPRGWTVIVTGEVSPAFYLVREPDSLAGELHSEAADVGGLEQSWTKFPMDANSATDNLSRERIFDEGHAPRPAKPDPPGSSPELLLPSPHARKFCVLVAVRVGSFWPEACQRWRPIGSSGLHLLRPSRSERSSSALFMSFTPSCERSCPGRNAA